MPRPGVAHAPSADLPVEAGVDDPTADALTRLWASIARPCSMLATVSTVTGLTRPEAGELLGATIATSPEAEALLDALPRAMRSLATDIGTRAERCIGELRGPVLWSETLSARASSFGDTDLFICATPSRAYDIDQNRVLVAAIEALRDAAHDATEQAPPEDQHHDPTLRAAFRNGAAASRFAEHPSLAEVQRGRPTPRAVKRTRTGKKRAIYRPALDLLDRVAEPLTIEQLRAACDERTCAQHRLLLGLVDRLEARGRHRLPAFRAEGGALWAGPIQYRHPRSAAETGHVGGIVVGDVLVDVPASPDAGGDGAPSGARWAGPTVVVTTEDDADRAIALASARAQPAP